LRGYFLIKNYLGYESKLKVGLLILLLIAVKLILEAMKQQRKSQNLVVAFQYYIRKAISET